MKLSRSIFLLVATVWVLLTQSCEAQPVPSAPATQPDSSATPPALRLTLPLPLRQYEEEIRAFEREDSAQAGRSLSILFTGSSSIRKWETLTQDFQPWELANRGFGGSRLYQVNAYFTRIIGYHKPRLIVLYAGENDLANDTTPAVEVAYHLGVFARLCHQELPGTHILFVALKPSPSRWKYWTKFQEANRLCRDVCAGDSLLHFMDTSPELLLASGKPNPSLFLDDKLHMNAAGYALWRNRMYPWIESFMQGNPIPEE